MISGTTALVAHLGYPTHTFKSSLSATLGSTRTMSMPWSFRWGSSPRTTATSSGSIFTLTNIRGALITMPHKVTTMELVDEISPTAEIAGATNVLQLDTRKLR